MKFIYEQPRTWDEIWAWSKERGWPKDATRQCVGYLESHGVSRITAIQGEPLLWTRRYRGGKKRAKPKKDSARRRSGTKK